VGSRRALWAATSARGGIATFVTTIEETALWTEWNVRLISTHNNGNALSRSLRFAVSLSRFTIELLIHRPDVVHLNTAAYGSFVRKSILGWLSKSLRIPVVLHMHGADFHIFYADAPKPLQAAIRMTLERMDALVALGDAWADSIREIAPRANIVVIPNAIKPIDAVEQQRPGDVTITFLGEIGDRKGTFTLIDAWAKIIADSASRVPARLTIAGDGDVDRARSRVVQLGLVDSVTVSDWMPSSAVKHLLDKTQVLVLPSREEGQPMAILEAMARGICVVASTVGGIPELLDDGCGVLVNPDDADQLATALIDVIGNPLMRATLGANALQRIHDHFDVDVVSRRFDELYRDVVSRN
jgi:glycosyltransferase involved in cell wall biosynthesis